MAKRPDHITTAAEWHACKRKRRYPDRGHAIKYGRMTFAFQREAKLWVYKCAYCRGYHLTHKPGADRDALHTIEESA